VSKAESIYRMWHQRNPDSQYEICFSKPLPPNVVKVGVALEIMYSSNKWSGKYEDYVHTCDSEAPVYECTDGPGDMPVTRLLHTPEVAELADMVQLTWRTNDGEDRTRSFKAARMLTPDRKTLVIVRPRGNPIFISGSKMRITARGIVR
jgi:hypothetical protein